MVSNKMIYGALLTVVGLTFCGLSFIYAAMNPWNFNGIEGLLASFLGTHMLIPFIVALIIVICGLVICFKEAYPDAKIW